MAKPTNAVRFNAAGYGTADFVVASAATGFVTPESANVTDGKTYRYYAQSADGTQWQAGSAPYFVSTHTLAQSQGTIAGTSNGDQNPVNFTLAPIVDVFASPSSFLDTPDVLYTPQTLTAAQQLQAIQNISAISYGSAQTLTALQKNQVQSNVLLAPTYTQLLSGSGTYTPPTGCTRIRVRMVGGGGGGSGSGSATGTVAGDGGNTTFGTSLLVANGGIHANFGAPGSAGGTASIGAGAIGLALAGSPGCGAGSGQQNGVQGASSPFGGAGGGGLYTNPGGPAVANTGSGGGGAGGFSGAISGTSGAAGGFVDAIINSPVGPYAWAVGAGGVAGGPGTGGAAGGAGAAGGIFIEEYYGS